MLNDPFFTPADGTNGRPFDPADASEDLRSDDVRVTYQINQKNKVNGFYEWQRNNQPNNFAYLNAGVSSMESGNPYCNHPQLFIGDVEQHGDEPPAVRRRRAALQLVGEHVRQHVRRHSEQPSVP